MSLLGSAIVGGKGTLEDPIIFKELGPLTEDESWVQLVYGASGTGKTWYVGTAGSRTLIINIGHGLRTLQSPLFRSKFPDYKPLVVDLSEKFEEGKIQKATALDLVCDALDKALYTPSIRERFDTIAIDDATALRRFALNRSIEIMNEMQSEKGGKYRRLDRYVWTDVSDKGKEIDIITWFLEEYIPRFKQEKVNFILVAHERQIFGRPSRIGDEPPLRAIKPGFTGQKFPDDVPRFFDDVWHFKIAGNVSTTIYQAWTGGNTNALVKTQHNGIFRNVENNPNFLKLRERIREGKLIENTSSL